MSTKDPLPHGPVNPQSSAFKPAPVSWKGPPGESCIVDKVLITNNDDGHMVIKARALSSIILPQQSTTAPLKTAL